MTDQITCGNCTRCIDVCPTNAFPEPYQLDARKCISYHTIENRTEIPKELSKNFGEWFFGCDLCQSICPYNKKAEKSLRAENDASPKILLTSQQADEVSPQNFPLLRNDQFGDVPRAGSSSEANFEVFASTQNNSSLRAEGETIHTFPEFRPEAGFGHWLNMEELIDLDISTHKSIKSLQGSLQRHHYIDKSSLIQINKLLNDSTEITEELLDRIFQIKFAKTPLLRPKRKGLIRNAKVVLTNSTESQQVHN